MRQAEGAGWAPAPDPDPTLRLAAHPQAGDPDAVYDVLLAHARVCRRCWEIRDRLWLYDRLCEFGQQLCVVYAQHALAARHD